MWTRFVLLSPPFPVRDVVLLPGLLPIFLHGCEIKSGRGLGTRLTHTTFLLSLLHPSPLFPPPFPFPLLRVLSSTETTGTRWLLMLAHAHKTSVSYTSCVFQLRTPTWRNRGPATWVPWPTSQYPSASRAIQSCPLWPSLHLWLTLVSQPLPPGLH